MTISTLPLTVTIETFTREEALVLGDFIARGFETRFFHDPDNVPIVFVTGGFNHGKSMMCEVMSRSILDQESVDEMIDEGQRFHHYLEDRPSSALQEYCFQMGTVDGVPAVVSFDRITEMTLKPLNQSWTGASILDDQNTIPLMDEDEGDGLYQAYTKHSAPPQKPRISNEQRYRNTFSEHTTSYQGLIDGCIFFPSKGFVDTKTGQIVPLAKAFQTKNAIGGAIFSSGHYRPDATPWIQFEVEQPRYGDLYSRKAAGALPTSAKGKATKITPEKKYNEDDPDHPKWDKVWTIEIHAPELKNSPRFQAFWKALEECERTGKLFEPDLDGKSSHPKLILEL